MQPFKRGAFDAAGQNLTLQAVEAKVALGTRFLGDADHLARNRFRQVGKDGVATRLQSRGGLQTTLCVTRWPSVRRKTDLSPLEHEVAMRTPCDVTWCGIAHSGCCSNVSKVCSRPL